MNECDHAELMRKLENKALIPGMDSVTCRECGQSFRPRVDEYNGKVYLRVDHKQ